MEWELPAAPPQESKEGEDPLAPTHSARSPETAPSFFSNARAAACVGSSMLHVRPVSLLSESYTISAKKKGRALTTVSIRWFREAGSFSLDGQTFDLGREGWMGGDFFLSIGRRELASADKPSAWHRRFTVRADGTKYVLQARSAFSRKFDLLRGRRKVGSIEPTSIWTRGATADLPAELPLELRVFMIWLALLLWKRARDSSSS